jgi:hypothetical protein
VAEGFLRNPFADDPSKAPDPLVDLTAQYYGSTLTTAITTLPATVYVHPYTVAAEVKGLSLKDLFNGTQGQKLTQQLITGTYDPSLDQIFAEDEPDDDD